MEMIARSLYRVVISDAKEASIRSSRRVKCDLNPVTFLRIVMNNSFMVWEPYAHDLGRVWNRKTFKIPALQCFQIVQVQALRIKAGGVYRDRFCGMLVSDRLKTVSQYRVMYQAVNPGAACIHCEVPNVRR
ncbi:hypothetical protein [Pseudomonas rhizosphaerae]|uniref:hypothetical protein n=1 Tax=Pseudomonas rhizosphaerae TaxID=216142 RepID=UPI0011DDAF72|nr:hypothetical protein [Pseudomonas rhizosphaerae]